MRTGLRLDKVLPSAASWRSGLWRGCLALALSCTASSAVGQPNAPATGAAPHPSDAITRGLSDHSAAAETPSPGSSSPANAAPPAAATTETATLPEPAAGNGLGVAARTCEERVPEGRPRPVMVETFPSKGKSGHQVVLVVEVRHGMGERVLPSAFHIDTKSAELREIEAAGFRFPSPKGPGAPRLHRSENEGEGKATTRVSLPLLALPSEPGSHSLVLPSLPIAVARASGEIITLCTSPHAIEVSDPIANEPNAQPKPNPAPKRQRELWHALKQAVYGGAVALAVAGALGIALLTWLRRPKKAPPPPPPRPPWDVALEALHDIRQAQLIESGRLDEHFDRVSAVLRRYLGDRYGFEGLESTTFEVVRALEHQAIAEDALDQVKRSLDESDLVKFAKQTPSEAQCHWLWSEVEAVVRRTVREPTPEPVLPQSETPQEQPNDR